MLIITAITIFMIMIVSLSRRHDRKDVEHMSPVLYWTLFALGAIFVLSQAVKLI